MQNDSLTLLGLDAAQAHQLIVRNAQLVAERPEVLFDQISRETGRGRRAPVCAW